MVGSHPTEWTLTEAARLLQEPEHRLIYLCEKGVVQPDVQDALGRGSSRRFSTRNLLDFAVALRLRELEIPASLAATVIYVLRAFETSVSKRMRGFRLPENLRDPDAPDLRVVISDGRRLYFTLRTGRSAPKVYGGLDLRKMPASTAARATIDRELAHAKAPNQRAGPQEFGRPEGSKHTRVEVNVTRIARDLRLEG